MTREHTKSGSRTLLMSVLLSSPGPLAMGLGLIVGRSSTQIADFIRRTAELLAIIISFVIYKTTNKDGHCDEARKALLERRSNSFVGAMMCLGGSFMIALTLMSDSSDKGNAAPALIIAGMGVITNTLFWRKYTRLHKKNPNAILGVQARLYRAKSLVDSCITLALLAVVFAPASLMSIWLDLIGSLVVAVYLVWCGIRTIWDATRPQENPQIA